MKNCIYSDGEIVTKGEHKFDKDGFCIFCGFKQDKIAEWAEESPQTPEQTPYRAS